MAVPSIPVSQNIKRKSLHKMSRFARGKGRKSAAHKGKAARRKARLKAKRR
jgi:hypothetical protein